MAVRGGCAGPSRPLVYRRKGPEDRWNDVPRGTAAVACRRVVGRLPGEANRRKERGSPVCSATEQCHKDDNNAAEPRGAREAVCRCRLPHGSANARRLCLLRIQGGRTPGKIWHRSSMRVQAARLRWGVATAWAVKLLSTQIVGKQAKAISSATARHIGCNAAVNAFQQYEGLTSLATAKFERRRTIFELAHPPMFETPRIH